MRCTESPRRERRSSISVPPTIWIRCFSGVDATTAARLSGGSTFGAAANPSPSAKRATGPYLTISLDSGAPAKEGCGSNAVPVLSYDTRLDRLRWLRRGTRSVSDLIEYALLRRPLDDAHVIPTGSRR